MKKLLFILPIFLLVFGCKSTQVVVPHSSDSTYVENSSNIVYRDTTIYVQVPVESKQTVEPDSSYLETTVAASLAYIRADGQLFHSIENKPVKLQSLPVKLPTVSSVHINTVYKDRAVEIEVKKPLTKVQKGLILSGILAWFALLLVGFLKLKKFI